MSSQPNIITVPRRAWVFVVLLAVLAGSVWLTLWKFAPDGNLRVSFYDIGQGDSEFIRTPRGVNVLIDGGPDSGVLRKLAADLPFFVRRLDLVVLTHPHADHMTGLIEVLRRYNVRNILITEAQSDSKTFQTFKSVLAEKHIRTIEAVAGQVIHLDSVTTLTTLYPFESLKGIKFTDLNETSIVNRLNFGAVHFLFMGDASKDEEGALLMAKEDVSADVLKVGHHGSHSATSEEFLKLVAPEFAVMSVGAKNRYSHPHEDTLQLLAKTKVSVLRTDQEGDIRFATDGKSLYKE